MINHYSFWPTINECDPGVPPAEIVFNIGLYPLQARYLGNWTGETILSRAYIYVPPRIVETATGRCYGLATGTRDKGQSVWRIWRKPGFYSLNYSYTATSTPVNGWKNKNTPSTPIYGTVVNTGVTFTPTALSSFTCTTPIDSGGISKCSGKAIGAPAGVNYTGTLVINVDNGGFSSLPITINSDGTFTNVDVAVGTNVTVNDVTKKATPSITGIGDLKVADGSVTITANIVVKPAQITIDKDKIVDSLDCKNTKVVTIPNTYDCTFNLVGAATGVTFNLPAGKIKAATSTIGNGAGNLTAISAIRSNDCTILTNSTATARLSCTAIPTNGGTAGLRNVLLYIDGSTTAIDKGDVSLMNSAIDPLFIPDTSLTISPNPPAGLSVFGDKDYTLVLKDDRIVTTPGQALNSSNASCTYRIKELSSPTDDNADRGWDALTGGAKGIISPHNNTGSFNTTSKLFEVTYNTAGSTNLGTSIKILKTNQKYSDYDLEIRCIRSSDNQVFSRDERINFLFGAYATVGITGVVVPV